MIVVTPSPAVGGQDFCTLVVVVIKSRHDAVTMLDAIRIFAWAPLDHSSGRRILLCERMSSNLCGRVANRATATAVATLKHWARSDGPNRRVLDNRRVDTSASVFSGSHPTGFSGSRPTGSGICRRQVSKYYCRRNRRGRDCRHDSPHVCTSSFRPCVSLIHVTTKTEMTREFRRGARELNPLALDRLKASAVSSHERDCEKSSRC